MAFRIGNSSHSFLLGTAGSAVAGLCTLQLVSRGLTTSSYTPPTFSAAAPASSPLAINPDPVDLGIIEQGESAEASVVLENSRSEPVVLDRVKTSCPCVRFTPASVTVGAGETAALTVTFDPLSDPEFVGGLGVEATGYDSRGRALFKTRVDLEVRRRTTTASVPQQAPTTTEGQPQG